MITFKSVNLIYPNGSEALKNIELTINKGDLVIITGPSGSGKTSLLKLMMGMEEASEGSVIVEGIALGNQKTNQKINQKTDLPKIRRQIGPIFQDLRLIKGKTALDNVILGMRFYGYDDAFMTQMATRALGEVGLGEKMDRFVENLSWGETQRVAIARAVARKPSYIIADEPTGSLDEANAIHILNLLAGFRDAETAVIITTHATHLIERFKDVKHIKIDTGRIHESHGESEGANE